MRQALLVGLLSGLGVAGAVLAGLECTPLPPKTVETGVDIVAVLVCLAAEELKGITDYGVMAQDCHLQSAQVVSDIFATQNARAARLCQGTLTTVHPLRIDAHPGD